MDRLGTCLGPLFGQSRHPGSLAHTAGVEGFPRFSAKLTDAQTWILIDVFAVKTQSPSRELDMTQLGMWLLAVMFLASGLLLIVFLLKNRFEPLGSGGWTIRDVVQLAGVILNIVALAIAVGAIQVAVSSYQDSKTAELKHQQELELSRKALEAVVATAQTEQQALENNLAVAKAQTEMIAEQAQREKERLARKPLVGLLYGESEVNTLANPIEVHRGAEFTRVSLSVRNNGDAPAVRGIVVVLADPPTIQVDRADFRLADRRNEHRFETPIPDLRPYGQTQDEFPLLLDLHGTIPDDFTISFNIFGENFEAVRRKVSFHVLPE